MLNLRPANERGHADHGWLETHHSFSFGGYYDPRWMGFRSLRVLNDDRVAPGGGFPMHGHENMEIVSYITEGAIAHEDSAGHRETIRPGQIQVMSAGSGIRHSEFNPSKDESMRLIQVWIEPAHRDALPRYADRDFSERLASGGLATLVSPDGRDGSLQIDQDATMMAARLAPGAAVRHATDPARGLWLQVVRGAVTANGQPLAEGDGATITDESALEIEATAGAGAEILLFDLA